MTSLITLLKEAAATYLKQLTEEPDHDEALNWASSFLLAALALKKRGHDTEEMLLARGLIFEKYGHDLLLHLISSPSELEAEGAKIITQTLLTVHWTLTSPIDDADKVTHLREELFPPGRLEQVLHMADLFGFKNPAKVNSNFLH
jgi:hypothetical protein